jgi:hypothetical protein
MRGGLTSQGISSYLTNKDTVTALKKVGKQFMNSPEIKKYIRETKTEQSKTHRIPFSSGRKRSIPSPGIPGNMPLASARTDSTIDSDAEIVLKKLMSSDTNEFGVREAIDNVRKEYALDKAKGQVKSEYSFKINGIKDPIVLSDEDIASINASMVFTTLKNTIKKR